MKYISTRGRAEKTGATRAIIKGIAEDRGLYVPEGFPRLKESWTELVSLEYKEVAQLVLSCFLPDFTLEELAEYTGKAYGETFEHPRVAPLVRAGNVHFLELYHGKTAAFKDMALSLLPYLLTASIRKEKEDKKIAILAATSGDTGIAALKGFEDVPGTEVIVFFPEEGVSPVQKQQMRTAEGSNTHVAGIEGNFDDAQRGVKQILNDENFAAEALAKGYKLTAANSINIGRLLPQVAYYVWAYARMVESGAVKAGDPVNLVVPSGNFGNLLSGYYAEKMGVPVRRYLCASNRNNVLSDFFRTGVYDARRPLYTTNAPSMDIIV
ncbi:MAG: threonine synthase, partial [Anaerovoracaceae bacterium]